MANLYDTVIIGGGPAGSAAAIYAGRKKLKTLLITELFGGQSVISDAIENWIGAKKISGWQLAKLLEDHARSQKNVEIITGASVKKIEQADKNFKLTTIPGKIYSAKTIIIASGSGYKHLNVPGEEKLSGKGVSYCSTCDAPLFRHKTVAVVGAGNVGLEAVVDLLPYGKTVYLFVKKSKITGDPITLAKIIKNEKVRIICDAETKEIMGREKVTGVKYYDNEKKRTVKLKVDGVFIHIGYAPNSGFAAGLIELNGKGEIIVNPRTGETSKPGIFAAGDVTDAPYKQNNIAAGDGVKAALAVYHYLQNTER